MLKYVLLFVLIISLIKGEKTNDRPIIGILSMPIIKDSSYASDVFSFIHYSYKVDLEASGLIIIL